MIIAFETKGLREICEDGAVATQELGPSIADALQQRLADLRAAASISDLVVGNVRVSGENSSRLTIDLTGSSGSVWCPNHVSSPLLGDGHVDWARVSRVRLLEIVRS